MNDQLYKITSKNIICFPNIGRNRSEDDLAVIVWAHAGAFFFGRGSHYPGQDLAVHGDLIVVTIKHRLGALGFSSTGIYVTPFCIQKKVLILPLSGIKYYNNLHSNQF